MKTFADTHLRPSVVRERRCTPELVVGVADTTRERGRKGGTTCEQRHHATVPISARLIWSALLFDAVSTGDATIEAHRSLAFAFEVPNQFVIPLPGRPLERALIFPMAVVPNVWGLWNVLYLALRHRVRMPSKCDAYTAR